MGDPEQLVVSPFDGMQQALIDAAGVCMARWGVSKTTVADLAGEAGCSRATVYRTFPGGKSEIMTTYALLELQAFFDDVSGKVASAKTLDDALVVVITGAARGLADHVGFQFMLAHEPGLVLPYLGFTSIDRLYRLATDALAGDFERFAGDRAPQLVELAARITLSHTFQPSDDLDLCDPADVRRLVERHLLPICADVVAGSDPQRTTSASPDLAQPAYFAVPA